MDFISTIYNIFRVLRRLLYEILPPTIARELRLGNVVRPERYERVTILFSGIVDFEKFTAARNTTNTGIEIVELLNEVYSRIDTLLDPAINPEIYKVQGSQEALLPVRTLEIFRLRPSTIVALWLVVLRIIRSTTVNVSPSLRLT